MGRSYCRVLFLVGVIFMTVMKKDSLAVQVHDYKDALTKSILFFEGQRSGKLPPTQRMTWRKDSALHDGFNVGLDLSGGYYDAGDNLKFNLPMAFSTTVLAWSVIEFGNLMDSDLGHAKEAIKWATDYFLKSTQIPNVVYVQVGEPYSDHACWQRPEDMDTDRTAYAVNATHPGSEVSAEIAAALAASSIVFKSSDPAYSNQLLDRASQVFTFADKYQGSYNDSLGPIVCPFYCDWGSYDDELAWAASWLYKATNKTSYWKYTVKMNLVSTMDINMKGENCEFGWDDKHAGVYVLSSIKQLMNKSSPPNAQYKLNADKFACSLLPDSTLKSVKYSPGGLMFKDDGSNMQNPTSLSFLLLIYARYLNEAKQNIQWDNKPVTPDTLVALAKSQVDYILGSNPIGLSYMVGYGSKFPQRIHHRGSSLPSIDQHPEHIECHGGTPYFESQDPNPNLLIGAVTGGPSIDDKYADSRSLFVQSEPTTYINAPLVGLLAYFSHNH